MTAAKTNMLTRWAAKLANILLRAGSLKEPERALLFNTLMEGLKQKTLSVEERQILTVALLDRLGALPLRAKIIVDKAGQVLVDGRRLGFEEATLLKQAAVAMKSNRARTLVREAVTFMAIVDGVYKNVTPEMGLFAKAALWFRQEEDALYEALASSNTFDE